MSAEELRWAAKSLRERLQAEVMLLLVNRVAMKDRKYRRAVAAELRQNRAWMELAERIELAENQHGR